MYDLVPLGSDRCNICRLLIRQYHATGVTEPREKLQQDVQCKPERWCDERHENQAKGSAYHGIHGGGRWEFQ